MINMEPQHRDPRCTKMSNLETIQSNLTGYSIFYFDDCRVQVQSSDINIYAPFIIYLICLSNRSFVEQSIHQ